MRHLIVSAAVIFGLVGCNQSVPPAVKGQATPASSVQPTGKGVPPATPPTTLDLRVAVIPLSCKLPVSIGTDGRGAFVTFPQGQVTISASAGAYYDRAYTQWLPAPRNAVSPDGRHYATI